MPHDVLRLVRPALLLALLALPAQAQEGRGLTDRMGRLFTDLLSEIDPWMADLADKLGDLTGWHAPEVLPNGDILIRRRLPQVQPLPTDSGSGTTEPFEL